MRLFMICFLKGFMLILKIGCIFFVLLIFLKFLFVFFFFLNKNNFYCYIGMILIMSF